jgi:hypothetical protein
MSLAPWLSLDPKLTYDGLLTFLACGLLCRHAGVKFIAPMISVADDSTVSDEVRTALDNALKGCETVVPWESPASGTSAAERK